MASSIDLCNFISQSLMRNDDKQIWINPKELSALFKNEKTIKIYLGLLLAKCQKGDVNIDFYNSVNSITSFDAFLIKMYGEYGKYESEIKSLIKNTITTFNSSNNAVKKIIAATDKSVEALQVDIQALYDYYRTITSSLNPIAHSTLLSVITGNSNIGKGYDKIEKYLNPSVDIAYHIATKKYSAAIYNAVVLLDYFNKSGSEKPVFKSFIKYGTLISTLASAQSSDEVKQAIESSVLPVGSYSIKSKTCFSISINSYVGGYWNASKREDYIPRFGITAPVGINFSKGISETGHCGSVSLNLQVIDVGALVNYYLINGDTATIPNDFNVRLSNIFSPGISLYYNFGGFPLSLGGGVQYIPTLYKIDYSNNEFTPSSAWRWEFSALIDIPLINLKV